MQKLSAPRGARGMIARSSIQKKNEEMTSATLDDSIAAAPIDLVMALESACWDLDFLVRYVECFFL